VGAIAYGLSGFLLLYLGWPLANQAALLPVLLYAVISWADRRRRRLCRSWAARPRSTGA
jgi:hypothetical protein